MKGISQGMKLGEEKGKKEGIEEGIKQGIEKGQLKTLLSMVNKGFISIEQAAEQMKISVKEFKEASKTGV